MAGCSPSRERLDWLLISLHDNGRRWSASVLVAASPASLIAYASAGWQMVEQINHVTLSPPCVRHRGTFVRVEYAGRTGNRQNIAANVLGYTALAAA